MLGVQHLAINRVQDKIEHKHNNNNYLRIYKNNKYSREIQKDGFKVSTLTSPPTRLEPFSDAA